MIVLTLARKPVAQSVSRNVIAFGTGGLNVDGCRVAAAGGSPSQLRRLGKAPVGNYNGWSVPSREGYNDPRPGEALGRWPSNVVFGHRGCVDFCEPDCPVRSLDEQSGESTIRERVPSLVSREDKTATSFKMRQGSLHFDSGGASRYFRAFGGSTS